jgi:hypothetical protein
MMVLTGIAIFSGLVIGTVAAAAGGVSSTTEIAVTRSQPPVGVAPGAPTIDGDGPSVVASAIAAVAGRWLEGQAVGAAADAGAVVTAAAEAAPVTVAAPATTEAAPTTAATAPAPTTTEPPVAETAAAAPAVVAAPPEAAPAASVASETAAVAAPAGTSVEAAIAAWFPDVYDEAIAVADCESSLNPGAMSRGGGNHGLFQINNVHRGNFEAITGQPWEMVYDAYYNSQYARRLYDASGWRPWTCQP